MTLSHVALQRRIPGPEIRVQEGDRLRVALENRLPDATLSEKLGILTIGDFWPPE